jgi:hypothetical protein
MTAADAKALHLADLEVRHANLLAVARALIFSAHRDGDPDPLAILRDELDAHGQLPADDMHPAQILAQCTCKKGAA